tara:strand:+ start:340 stop:603 length:264 start_codon:yes stop_codon:yes gene_type:complete
MAPARRRKSKVVPPQWTDEDRVAYRWCINNGIKISPWAATSDRDNYHWWIDVEVNGAKRRSPKTYNGRVLNEKIFELYRFYYDKNKV